MSNSNDEGIVPSRRAFTATLGAALGTALLTSCGDQGQNTNHSNANHTPGNPASGNQSANTNSEGEARIRIAYRPIIIRNGSLTLAMLDNFASFFQENAAQKTATVANTNLRVRSLEVISKEEEIFEILDVPAGKQVTASFWVGPVGGAPGATPEFVVKTDGSGKNIVWTFTGHLPSAYTTVSLDHPKAKHAKAHPDPNVVVQQIRWAVPGTLAITAPLPKDVYLEFILID